MKVLTIISIFLLSCGTEGIPGVDGQDGKNCYDEVGDANGDGETNSKDCIGATGKAGTDGRDGADYTPPTPSVVDSFINYWYLPYGGYLELVETNEGRVAIFGASLLVSSNSGDSSDLANHPRLPTSSLAVQGNKISGSYTARYRQSNNLKNNNGSVIDDSRLTTYLLEIKDEKLRILLETWKSDKSGIEVSREIIAE